MRIILAISFLGLLVSFFSCQSEPELASPELLAKKLSFPINIPKAKEGSLPIIREHVGDVIRERQRSMKESLFDLTYYYIQPQYFSNLNVMNTGEELRRHWIKFEDDYKYEYGIGPELVGSGTYHYAPSDQRLLILDNDPQVEPKMWTILSNSEFMNFLGHPLLVAKAGSGKDFLLQDNFSNDPYIESLGKLVAEAHNGMQIKMMLLENQPQ